MTRLHESHVARIIEDQQPCFADLITDEALFALLDMKAELA